MPIISLIIAVLEVFIYSIIFYSVLAHLLGKKLNTKLLGWTIIIQLSAIIYMLTRLKPAQILARTQSTLELLVVGHALLSILVFFWLVISFFKARNFALVGKNYLQENKKSTYLFLAFLSLSLLSGELIFFLVY
ncbi:MAG: hypothetical protein RBG1_1C00001G0506 [candidate division Zixibacteria bacterium RBG-1]|nr:MAG: hypothetical protein RBG1_1C00001G0506 [candidate division Zixibacteria bacterium RBG-1]OGC84829.1 MAG: hypothetical protein A2V73_00115 [candidate division Zixibacteria bacterium RBG_19FT_COMBO_42_43]